MLEDNNSPTFLMHGLTAALIHACIPQELLRRSAIGLIVDVLLGSDSVQGLEYKHHAGFNLKYLPTALPAKDNVPIASSLTNRQGTLGSQTTPNRIFSDSFIHATFVTRVFAIVVDHSPRECGT